MNGRLIAGGSLSLAVALAALAFVLTTQASPRAQAAAIQGEANGISVVGEGIVLVEPNQARVQFGVEVLDASLSNAQQEAANRMQAVLAKLQELGIDQQDIETVRFSVHPEYRHDSGEAVLTGYRVSNVVSVTVRDISSLGPTIDSVVGAGAVRVDGIGFEIADPSSARAQGRELAMANARSKAEQLARLAGVSLGQPLLVEESDIGDVPPVPFATDAARAAEAATPIMPGELEIHSRVRVVYAIQ